MRQAGSSAATGGARPAIIARSGIRSAFTRRSLEDADQGGRLRDPNPDD